MPRPAARPAPGRAAPLFAALGDATRLKLVARMSARGPLSIARLAEGSSLTRQAITKHLKVMEEIRLVRSRRRGRERIWSLEPRRVEEARRYLEAVASQWDAALDRLQRLVEK